MKKFLRSTFLLLNIVAVLWLLLCKFVSLYNTESDPSLLSLISFSTFFAYFLNVVFLVFWLLSKTKIRFLISLVTLIICWSLVKPIFGFNYFGDNKVEPNDGGLKIMTWNVHLFDLGEWTKDETSKAKIIQLIQDENPDVVCLEEFYWDPEHPNEPYTSIIQQLGYPYVQLSENSKLKKRKMTLKSTKNEIIYSGDAIFSKYPIQNPITYKLENYYNMLSVDIAMDSNNIFNLNVIHLTSVGFGNEDLEFIEEVKTKVGESELKTKSKGVLKKLMNASSHRAQLANKVDSIKKLTEYPIIICGDFNDVPGSYVYNKVKGKLSDAFSKKGAGFGRTYHSIFPTLRIDYILFDGSALKAEGYLSRSVGLSDHYPVIANFSMLAK